MAEKPTFTNLDEREVYDRSLEQVRDESSYNFVVEFGICEARISFNLDVGNIKALLQSPSAQTRPVRWINIWAPNRQIDLVELLAVRYGFSPRLHAIIRSIPPDPKPQSDDRHANRQERRSQQHHKDDVELAATSIDTSRANTPALGGEDTSHYAIAKHMVNYQSIDFGTKFLCVGANWMHRVAATWSNDKMTPEASQGRLWSWLVLCDDNTVITLHEDTGPVNDPSILKSMRANIYSVLSQLSIHGHHSADPISMQTVRQALDSEANPGHEGASNLFYYLFDDWRAVYSAISGYRQELEELRDTIINGMTRTSNTAPNIQVIPRLHILGRHIRQMEHLYAGYKNLIKRILESKANTANGVHNRHGSSNLHAGNKGVTLAQSAGLRFERLGDRIQFLILNETHEFLTEKDALISTYFNINAQKDSEATARLTRAATLLAKLSVLFLPVSLMTSYFSVQIPDLQTKYTSKDYWEAFAIIVSISFVCLFFFSRLLMWVTETLDTWVRYISIKCARLFRKARSTSDADQN